MHRPSMTPARCGTAWVSNNGLRDCRRVTETAYTVCMVQLHPQEGRDGLMEKWRAARLATSYWTLYEIVAEGRSVKSWKDRGATNGHRPRTACSAPLDIDGWCLRGQSVIYLVCARTRQSSSFPACSSELRMSARSHRSVDFGRRRARRQPAIPHTPLDRFKQNALRKVHLLHS